MRRPHLLLAARVTLLLLCAAVSPRALPAGDPGRPPQQAAPARRPLRLLALGDSVMWGQGLLDRNKFTYRIRDWLCGRRGDPGCRNGRDVELHVLAHSGAVVSEPAGRSERRVEEKFIRADSPLRYDGEVNYAYPTLWGQLELARRHYGKESGEVDLVFVNGCINDVNATRLLKGRVLGGNVERQVRKFCGKEMTRFLPAVADAFPNARIVVPGYFPLITRSTPPRILLETLWEWLFRDEEAEAEAFAEFQEDWKARPGESAAEAEARVSKKIERLAERSRDFVKASDEALAEAVRQLNSARPLPGAPARALFVPVPFGDHGYGAAGTFLWRLGRKDPSLVLNCARDNLVTRFVVDDEMQQTRPCACEEAVKMEFPRTKYLTCFRAGAFHPNREGANAYFEAIRDELEKVVDSAGWVVKN